MNTNEEKPLIWIKKITKGNIIEDDILLKSDIKRVRRWHKNAQDADIEGEICLVTVRQSKGIPDAMVKVNESLESLTTRLGNVDTLAGQ